MAAKRKTVAKAATKSGRQNTGAKTAVVKTAVVGATARQAAKAAPKAAAILKRAARARIGVIGGSGLYAMEGLTATRWRKVATPWGDPSDELLFGKLGDQELVFLPRHGRGHRVPPSDINYRANIDALKRAGCVDVISVSACGSLKEEHAPGKFVLVDQFIDRTFARVKSFFGPGVVAHVSMAHPVCLRLRDKLAEAASTAGIEHSVGGTYLVMEGPQFSSLAESRLYRSWGCDVIGMTNMPEAKLAREAELCYTTVSMVTDYDCWHPDHDHVDVASVIKVVHDNAHNAQNLIKAVAPLLAERPETCPQGCDHALDNAIMTAPAVRDRKLVKKLDAVAGRVLKG